MALFRLHNEENCGLILFICIDSVTELFLIYTIDTHTVAQGCPAMTQRLVLY